MDKRIFYKGVVIDNSDPLRLGRIIVEASNFRVSDKKYIAEYEGTKSIEGKDKWDITVNPFILKPLIPNNFSFVPKIGEMVNIIYTDLSRDFVDGFYIPTSSVDRGFFDGNSAEHSQSQSREGLRYKKGKELVKENGEYVKKKYDGALPKLEDYSISGRINSDVVWSDNAVVIRAGKINETISSKQNEVIRDENPAMVQVSKYDTTQEFGEPKKTQTTESEIRHVEILVEYSIEDIETSTGTFYIYKLSKNEGTTETIYFNNITEVSDDDKELIYSVQITEPTLVDLGLKLRHTIKSFFVDGQSGIGNLDGFIKHPSNVSPDSLSSIYPVYFRPSPSQFNELKSNATYTNFIDFIRVRSRKSHGLLFSDNEDNTPTKTTEVEINTIITKSVPSKNVIILSDTNFQLAYGNNIPTSKVGIDFNKVSNYRITQQELVKGILPETFALVRGEQLQNLLDVIYLFLTTHVHNPAEPAVVLPSVKQELEQQFQDFKQNILSQKNRIN